MATQTNMIEMKVSDTSTKEVYHFVNRERRVNILSKIIFKNKDRIIQYPFRNDNGQPKYESIKQIIFNGFDDKLPRGVYKNFTRGYGFTKVLNPLLYYLQTKFKIEKVIVNIAGRSSLNKQKKEVTFSFRDLDQFYPQIKNLFDSQSEEKNNLVKELLGRVFYHDIESKAITYKKHTVYSFLQKWGDYFDEFSREDIVSISSIFSRISRHAELVDKTVMLKTRRQIEEYFIEDVLETFNDYLKQKTVTQQLEGKWQEFFATHTWIFSQLFSFPVILFQDQAYVGGKAIDNKDGKLGDFLLKNNLTNNAAFVEIKTHKTEMLKTKPYRGKDVFGMSDELSGAISQILNQRDNFQKEFYNLKGKSKKLIESFNSKCIVLIGMIEELEDDQLQSFELIRSNSKDVEIVTFDELHQRLLGLQSLMR